MSSIKHLRTEDKNYAKAYWDTYDSGKGYGDSVLWEDIAHIIKEMWGYNPETGEDISQSVDIMDLGCAMGYLVRHLRRRGFETFGLDISKYAVGMSDVDVKKYVHVWDMSWVDGPYYGWDRFHLVVCLETLEHIKENLTMRCLNNINRMMLVGGQGLLAICVEENPGWESDPTHVNVKPRAWWVPRLKEAGLHIVDEGEEYIRSHHYWREHNGIFVVEKTKPWTPKDQTVETQKQEDVTNLARLLTGDVKS